MKILVLNCGSSSVKYKLIDTANDNTLAEGGVEKIGLEDGFLKFKRQDGSKEIVDLGLTDHNGAISAILNNLTDEKEGCIKSFEEIDAVGHRVVHGGEKFNSSVLINEDVIAKVKECYGIAPLHNPANMTGIEAITALMPNVPQVGVFDTAFHQTMPAKSYMYALPYKYYAEDGIRRYGFHGTSHRYVSQRVCQFLGVDITKQRIITCHVGNGGSITAIVGGKSVDTSMGLTPTEGLMMGTRVGDINASSTTKAVLQVSAKSHQTCAKLKPPTKLATNAPFSLSLCMNNASSNTSVHMQPKWAVLTSSCLLAVLAKTKLAFAKTCVHPSRLWA